jgi:hypothetical protein
MIDIPRLLGVDVMPTIGVDGCMLYKVFEPKGIPRTTITPTTENSRSSYLVWLS